MGLLSPTRFRMNRTGYVYNVCAGKLFQSRQNPVICRFCQCSKQAKHCARNKLTAALLRRRRLPRLRWWSDSTASNVICVFLFVFITHDCFRKRREGRPTIATATRYAKHVLFWKDRNDTWIFDWKKARGTNLRRQSYGVMKSLPVLVSAFQMD